jgi:hypothetical protein
MNVSKAEMMAADGPRNSDSLFHEKKRHVLKISGKLRYDDLDEHLKFNNMHRNQCGREYP